MKCKYCDYTNQSKRAMEVHVSTYHEDRLAQETTAPARASSRVNTACPKCGLAIWRSSGAAGVLTVCPSCLEHYEIGSGKDLGPPKFHDPLTRRPLGPAFTPEAEAARAKKCAAMIGKVRDFHHIGTILAGVQHEATQNQDQ